MHVFEISLTVERFINFPNGSIIALLYGDAKQLKKLKSASEIETLTRMWANAQRDGRPAEYRWRPLFNAAKFG